MKLSHKNALTPDHNMTIQRRFSLGVPQEAKETDGDKKLEKRSILNFRKS